MAAILIWTALYVLPMAATIMALWLIGNIWQPYYYMCNIQTLCGVMACMAAWQPSFYNMCVVIPMTAWLWRPTTNVASMTWQAFNYWQQQPMAMTCNDNNTSNLLSMYVWQQPAKIWQWRPNWKVMCIDRRMKLMAAWHENIAAMTKICGEEKKYGAERSY